MFEQKIEELEKGLETMKMLEEFMKDNEPTFYYEIYPNHITVYEKEDIQKAKNFLRPILKGYEYVHSFFSNEYISTWRNDSHFQIWLETKTPHVMSEKCHWEEEKVKEIGKHFTLVCDIGE